MAISIWEFALVETPLVMPPGRVGAAEAGAVLEFLGVVRGLEGEERIAGIDYAWHPRMALRQLERIGGEAAQRFPLLPGCVLHHRVGFVPAGDASLGLRVCTGHRAPALEATGWLIERLKQVVPIWKHPRPHQDSATG